ncbi:hypothetical protein CRG98_016120 [Punica granatum]|uniref:Uncharacterized protein n=1 Tax=Punica granatum TaxID=22663 RepID=A0A2I0K5N2_PUNGR|nr:hypothetical protein CRG98_016120 [Punica granatum]
MYQMNYTPCRYVRISCLRGNPIAIFFIQLIGVPVVGLEPEFQPVVSHLLPQIVAHKQDIHDMHLQLLQDMTNKLVVFLPQLEVDLASFTDDAEGNLRFLAMIAGPFYPILYIVNERETTRSLSIMPESDVSKSPQPSALTVSSNFEPRRSRSTSPLLAASSSTAFRPDAVFTLLRKAYKDADLGVICKMASRLLQQLTEPAVGQQTCVPTTRETSMQDETVEPVLMNPFPLVDYSSLFGEEFHMPDDEWDTNYFNILDLRAVEEGILHVLYACASQPTLCCKLAENSSQFWSALPIVQALLPALRPSGSSLDHFDESFSAWRQPFIQQALSQIVMTTSSSVYRPLLHATAGYLSSFSPSHVKAACVLIDLCSSVLAPWVPQMIAKVDLAVELLEDLLSIVQGASHSLPHARAALKYILLALSGHMDDLLGKYKEVKRRILFLIEMLEPFLDPAITKFKSSIAFGDVSSEFSEKKEHNCEIALNVIRTAIRKSAVLPSLEYEWRSGSVTPRVLLSILEPHLQLPPEIDLRKSSASEMIQQVSSSSLSFPSAGHGSASSRTNGEEEPDGKIDMSDAVVKMETFEDGSSFFASPELKSISLTVVSSTQEESSLDAKLVGVSTKQNHEAEKSFTDHLQSNLVLDDGFAAEYFNLQEDYYRLANYGECEVRATEFQRLASDLHSQQEISVESHDAAVDALLLAAECYINPFFMMSSKASGKVLSHRDVGRIKVDKSNDVLVSKKFAGNSSNMESIARLEKKRDKVVLQLLLEAAELDRNYWEMSGGELRTYYSELSDGGVIKLSPGDVQTADAITLVRQNQSLLCKFLIRQLQRERNSMHEVLMQSLLFLLEWATTLSCDPGDVIDIMLSSGDCLNRVVVSHYHHSKEGNSQSPGQLHQVRRHWILLQKLIIASSGSDQHSEFKISRTSDFRYGALIPFSAWIEKIPSFSGSASPLVRFLGWMAVSRNARRYIKDQTFLTSELSQLTCLLSIFADDLSMVDKLVNRKEDDTNVDDSHITQASTLTKGHEGDGQSGYRSFNIIYPDLCRFFPNMKKQFELFGETILDAVALQLKSFPSTVLPDILCWFSESCLSPFLWKDTSISPTSSDRLKSCAGKNAKAIILYVLEAIVVEHMEAMVHEIPRLVHVLVSLCRAPYCDVSFLGSVLLLLNPIISYSMQKFSDEVLLADELCLNFESLCFNELFSELAEKDGSGVSSGKLCRRPLIIFVLASVLPDLSFQHRRETLQSLLAWSDFTVSEPTSSFHDYLCAFQCLLDSCKLLLFQTLSKFGAIPLQLSNHSGSGTTLSYDGSSKSDAWFLNDILSAQLPTEGAEKTAADAVILVKKINSLSMEEIKEFTEHLERLLEKLYPTLEHCWTLHHQFTKKLVITAAECFIFSRCLSSLMENFHHGEGVVGEYLEAVNSVDQLLEHWRVAVQGVADILPRILQSYCWVVSSLMLDCLLAVPTGFPLNVIIGTICSAITSFSSSAPKISWRLQTDKWLSMFLARGFYNFNEIEVSIVELFSVMLAHHEPEQRLIALKHLGKLVGQDVDGDTVVIFSKTRDKLISPTTVSAIPESILSILISSTWDYVTLMASSDTSFVLRTRAMALLVDYIPFAKRDQLQSFLACSDTVLHGLGKFPQPSFDCPLFQVSLALIAGACLYSLEEDISLIPENVWMNIETLAASENESKIGDLERRTCQVLCRLKIKGNEEEEALREALSSTTIKQPDPDFGSTREAILQVLTNLTSAQSYIDAFSTEIEHFTDQEVEMELEVIQNEHPSQQLVKTSKESHQIASPAAPPTDESRIKQIKDRIVSIDKSKLREDIIARRQKKLVMRHARQKFLEEAALHEAELLQELDRERVAEVEKEIERQRLLETERAKTRELRLNLDLERERQTQRELQREMEQIESGVWSSRREIPSSSQTSRSRDRYRERESARSSAEASGRTTEPQVLARSYSGQPPVILQSRDRADEYGSGYEENLDGSKDSGDANSVGDPELMSAFEGQSGQRHSGSRGSKSRQARERERESRREGKWERKHP